MAANCARVLIATGLLCAGGLAAWLTLKHHQSPTTNLAYTEARPKPEIMEIEYLRSLDIECRRLEEKAGAILHASAGQEGEMVKIYQGRSSEPVDNNWKSLSEFETWLRNSGLTNASMVIEVEAVGWAPERFKKVIAVAERCGIGTIDVVACRWGLKARVDRTAY
jgi:hypothetical protein